MPVKDLVAVPEQAFQHGLQAGLATQRPIEEKTHNRCVITIWEVCDFVEERMDSRQDRCILREEVLDGSYGRS
jgi:hypothetical protein